MEKHKVLIQLLLERSKNGNLEWKDTPRDGVYQVPFATNAIQIQMSGDDVVVSLVNDRGDVVNSFSDTDLDSGTGGPQYYKVMLELYNLARRIALGSESILDNILGELQKPAPRG